MICSDQDHRYECQNFCEFFFKYSSFYLPDYQRHFVWGKGQLLLLIENMKENHREDKELWLGVILLQKKSGGVISIIDGQQRIITMFLILKNLLDWHDRHIEIKRSVDYNSVSPIYTLDAINEYLRSGKKPEDKNTFEFLKVTETEISELKNNENFESLKSFITNRVHFSLIWSKVQEYDYFESLNAKGVKLSLAEQCMGFLVTYNKSSYYENFRYLSWINEEKQKGYEKHTNDFRKDGSNFFGVFVDIYCDDYQCKKFGTKNRFFKFVNFIKREHNSPQWIKVRSFRTPLQFFYLFLRKTFEFFKKQNKTPLELYIERVCCQNFWWWYIEILLISDIELKNSLEDKVVWLDLLHAVWRFKHSIKKHKEHSFLQQTNTSNETIFKNFFGEFIEKDALEISQINQVIEAKSLTTRIKMLILLINFLINRIDIWSSHRHAQVKKEFERYLTKDLLSDFFIRYQFDQTKFTLEHLLPREFEDTYHDDQDFHKLGDEVDTIENIILVDKNLNSTLGNGKLQYKINFLFQENKLDQANRELFLNVLEIGVNTNYHIVHFLEKRREKIEKVLNEVNDFLRGKIPYKVLVNHNHRKEDFLNQAGFFNSGTNLWTKGEITYFVKNLTYKGNKDSGLRLPINDEERKKIRNWYNKNNNVCLKVAGFNRKENRLFILTGIDIEIIVFVWKGSSSIHFNYRDWTPYGSSD